MVRPCSTVFLSHWLAHLKNSMILTQEWCVLGGLNNRRLSAGNPLLLNKDLVCHTWQMSTVTCTNMDVLCLILVMCLLYIIYEDKSPHEQKKNVFIQFILRKHKFNFLKIMKDYKYIVTGTIPWICETA